MKGSSHSAEIVVSWNGTAHGSNLNQRRNVKVCMIHNILGEIVCSQNNTVNLETVTRIQHGQMTANFERHKQTFGGASGNSFSLIYGDNRSLDLIAPSPEVFRTWFLGIKQVLQALREKRAKLSAYVRYLQAQWDAADADRSGTLTQSEVIDLVSKMNANRSKSVIKAMYKQVDIDNSGTLNFDEFCQFMNLLRQRSVSEFHGIDCVLIFFAGQN